MRVIWSIFGCLLLALLGFRFGGIGGLGAIGEIAGRPTVGAAKLATDAPTQRAGAVAPVLSPPSPSRPGRAAAIRQSAGSARRDSLVRGALRLVGTPYAWAGSSPTTGFDCSGFVRYAFGQVGVAMPHATALLIGVGRPVARAQARPGDVVVFTGTAAGSTSPGHAGIVVSALGEVPLRFVHASSARRASGVKLSQVEGTDYERRFMQVRRVEL